MLGRRSEVAQGTYAALERDVVMTLDGLVLLGGATVLIADDVERPSCELLVRYHGAKLAIEIEQLNTRVTQQHLVVCSTWEEVDC